MRCIWKVGFVILALILLAGCKKDDINTQDLNNYQDEFRFYTNAKINGLPVNFNAGEEEYALETDYSISDSILIMEGILAKVGKPQQNALILKIRGNEPVINPEDFRVEQSLRPGLYAYRDRSGEKVVPGMYELEFFGDTSYYPMNFHWKFPDGSSSYLKNPTARTVLVDDYDPYNVSMTTDYSGCESRVAHAINLEDDCDATFAITNVTNTECGIQVIARNGNIKDVSWTLDGFEVSPDFYGVIHAPYLGGNHTLTAEINFENGCQKVVEREFDGSSAQPCYTDFWYKKSKITVQDPEQLGAVELVYYDENGKMFSSYYSSVEGSFKIVSLSPYLANEQGQKTTRFFFEAEAILKNADGSSVELTECFGSFALAHP